jgi:hypothetical protein
MIDTWADFEAALNIFTNLLKLLCFLSGFVLIGQAVFRGKSDFILPFLQRRLIRHQQFLVGFQLIVVALLIPGMINWCFTPICRY